MKIIFDACSVINLINAESLSFVLKIPKHDFYMQGICIEECGDLSKDLMAFIQQGRLIELTDDEIPISLFSSLLRQYRLGAGETECLCFTQLDRYAVCSDDKAARRAARHMVGTNRVIGSLGLLKLSVRYGLLSRHDAYARYIEMLRCGAFLPSITSEFFS